MNRTKTALIALALSVSTLTGCYGKFALVRKVYGFNGSISGDKFIRSLVTWIFVWLPVYGLASFGDFVIFNVIEFWTGSNPIDSGRINTSRVDDVTMTAQTVARDGEPALEFTTERDGGEKRKIVVTKVGDDALEMRFFDAEGNLEKSEIIPMRELSAERMASMQLAAQ